jgi:DNA-directed RNA polymerase specialized sigma subunit
VTGFNPFPRAGLTKTFEPFIRKEVARYCEIYPHVPRRDMLGEGVRLSLAAEARFDPKRGKSFATFVAYRLRELHRFAESYDGHQRVKVYEDPAVKAKRLAEERGEDPNPIAFKGGNGPRLAFDWRQ